MKPALSYHDVTDQVKDGLNPRQMYQVVYMLDYQRVPRVIQGRFLGIQAEDGLLLDGRPVFGTTRIPMYAIQSVKKVTGPSHPIEPRKVQA